MYTYEYTHILTLHLIHSFVRSFLRFLVLSFIPSFFRSIIPLFVCLLACLFIQSPTRWLIHHRVHDINIHNVITLYYIYICVGLQCAIYLGKLSWPNNSLTINACLCMGNQSYWACFWFGPGSITRTRSGFLWWTKQHLANHALLNRNEHHDTIKTIISMFQPLKMYHKPR